MQRQLPGNSQETDRGRSAGARGLPISTARPTAFALLVLTFAVLLMRVPFAPQAVQLDDVAPEVAVAKRGFAVCRTWPGRPGRAA